MNITTERSELRPLEVKESTSVRRGDVSHEPFPFNFLTLCFRIILSMYKLYAFTLFVHNHNPEYKLIQF